MWRFAAIAVAAQQPQAQHLGGLNGAAANGQNQNAQQMPANGPNNASQEPESDASDAD